MVTKLRVVQKNPHFLVQCWLKVGFKTKEPKVFCTINSISKLVNHPKEIHHHHIHHWVEISGPKKNI